MLHIIERSPYTSTALSECLSFAQPSSELLLIGGGVYAITQELLHKNNDLKVFAIREDVEARGIEKKAGIDYIDYAGMVLLTERNSPIMTWS